MNFNFNVPNRRSFLQRSLVFLAGLTATPLLGRNKVAPDASTVSNALKPVVSSEPYIGEIMLFAGNFAPKSWAFCDGQIILIAQNTALFSLIGTTYGGNGQTTFALPDLRGRMAFGAGSNSSIPLGGKSGAETTPLVAANIPPSITFDKVQIRTAGTQGAGLSNGGTQTGSPNAVPTNGSAATPMSNMPPYAVMNYIIAVNGVVPTFD